MAKKVYVGMSGGVDSSVSAALLLRAGYEVTGVYMKNWTKDLPGMICPWERDFKDAKRVAVQLGIDLKVYDFQKEYRKKVVDYMLNEYKLGRTPNPDVMCNQEVKFKLFLESALEDGADMIATGHYARVAHTNKVSEKKQAISKNIGARTSVSILHAPQTVTLQIAANTQKDQTYFLYRVTEDALARTLFPLGDIKTKDEVRMLARKFGLATAEKKDSQGICFVGKVGIKDFILNELGPQQPGTIINETGQTIGRHDGAIFYTIGQRHGLDVGGGLPYYVTGKDMKKNQVFVTTDLDDSKLWSSQIKISQVHWINRSTRQALETMSAHPQKFGIAARTRYRAKLAPVTQISALNKDITITMADEQRAVTPGQSLVLYGGQQVLGGGIVTSR